MGEEYATLRAELSGTGTMDVDTVGPAQGANQTFTKNDCSQTCKVKLDEMGV